MTRPRLGPLCLLAIGFCEQPKFQAFSNASSAAEAKRYILNTCGVESRKELDANADAAAKFHAMRRRYAYGGTND